MDVKYVVFDHWQMHKRALSFNYFLSIFHTFSVNSQNTFLSLIYVCNKCLGSIKKCSRTIVDLKSTHLELKISSYLNILHTFFGRTWNLCIFLPARENRLCFTFLLNEFQNLKKCTSIFDVSRKSLSTLTWIHNILSLLNTKCATTR